MGGTDMDFIGLLRTLEAITRPPRLGHDDDRPLPDYEPVSPDGYYGYAEPHLEPRGCLVCHGAGRIFWAGDNTECSACGGTGDDTRAPTEPWEPELNSSERVALRQLIEERFNPGDDSFKLPFEVLSAASKLFPQHTKSSPAVVGGPVDGTAEHRAAAGESAPSPTIVQSAPPPTVDGEGSPADSGIPPSPAGERPTSELLTDAAVDIRTLVGADSPFNKSHGPSCRILAPHYVTPTGMDHQCYCGRPQDHSLDDFGHRPHICPCGQLWADLPTKPSGPRSEDAAAAWIGEAVPVIRELLTQHYFYLANHSSIGSEDHCLCGHRPRGPAAWNAHISPLIANALAPHDK